MREREVIGSRIMERNRLMERTHEPTPVNYRSRMNPMRPFPCGSIRYSLMSLLLLALLVLNPLAAQADFALSVTLHTVEAEIAEGSNAYQVRVFTSVLDDTGTPIKQLTEDEFSLLEDSQPVDFSLREAPDVPISLVLVLDTSGSMAGTGLAQAKEAATKFITRLGSGDRVALISFNSKITNVSDFTADTAALSSAISTLNVVPNSGTCLNDAIYEAVQKSSVLPSGRRAVLVFTDGRDELPDGSVCSSMKVDDVIELATATPNTPIHAIGVGKELDEKALDRMALLTGGSFLKSEAFSQVEGLFDKVFEQLKYQYELTYQSNASAGRHNLTVQVNLGGNIDEDTRSFNLPDLPTGISFGNVSANQVINSTTVLQIRAQGGLDGIQSVAFEINGLTVANDDEAPFEFTLNPAGYAAGNLEITARALSADGKPIDSTQIVLQIQSTGAAAPAVESTRPAGNQPAKPVEGGLLALLKGLPVVYLVAVFGVGLVLLIFIVAMVIRLTRGKKARKAVENYDNEPATETMILRKPSANELAILTVIHSDDKALIGQQIPILNKSTSLGRSTGNDIAFPKDNPVSRKHATLEYKDGTFILTEVLKSGENGLESPTFGTYLNDQKINGRAVQLRAGDIIRLGNRLNLEFTPRVDNAKAGDSDRTMDDIEGEVVR